MRAHSDAAARRAAAGASLAVAVMWAATACGLNTRGAGPPSPCPTTVSRSSGRSLSPAVSASPTLCGGGGHGLAAKEWRGTLSATATVTYTTAGGTSGPFTGFYAGTLVLAEDSRGVISGHASLAAHGCKIPKAPPLRSVSFNVSGTDNGKRLELHIVASGFRLEGADCGFGYGFAPIPNGSPSSAIIPITGPGIAAGRWHGRNRAHPTSNFTVDYQFQLACMNC